jgi:hypothetical protein
MVKESSEAAGNNFSLDPFMATINRNSNSNQNSNANAYSNPAFSKYG